MHDLEARVTRLERRERRWRWIAASTGITIVAIVLMGAGGGVEPVAPDHARALAAEQFILVDAEGNMLGVWHADGDTVKFTNGTRATGAMAHLTVDRKAKSASLTIETEDTQVSATAHQGKTHLGMNGMPVVTLTRQGTRAVLAGETNGLPQAFSFVTEKDSTSLTIGDTNGALGFWEQPRGVALWLAEPDGTVRWRETFKRE